MKKDYKKIWKKLEKCLDYEKKTLRRNLDTAIKEENFTECLEFKEILLTVDWVKEEMEHLKRTGRLK